MKNLSPSSSSKSKSAAKTTTVKLVKRTAKQSPSLNTGNRKKSLPQRKSTKKAVSVAILGAGNIGLAIAGGLARSGKVAAKNIFLTRRNADGLAEFTQKGFRTGTNNVTACTGADIIFLAVQPKQLNAVLSEIAPILTARQILISVVSGASVDAITQLVGNKPQVVRAMPNTAIAIQESMTCLCSPHQNALEKAKQLFDVLGATVLISEELMIPATALCACGIAFFLRAIRAASQGGIEIGFHSDQALLMAAQTAKGAASLLLAQGDHPENEVDKVTTPRGCTISGLNQMEHSGFSSALIKGIITSAEKAANLYS